MQMTSQMRSHEELVRAVRGPILVLGASGFVGANLLRMLRASRRDAFGTASRLPAWRLEGLPADSLRGVDLLVDENVGRLLDELRPQTIFNCLAYGAYSFQSDVDLIYRTNLNLTARLLEEVAARGIACYVHAGTSSEYGARAAGPGEEQPPAPNSHYAAAKAGAAGLIHYMGTTRGVACVNLRLYSVYGPYEEPARLIPQLLARGLEGKLPELVDPSISRDLVYVDDACRAFICAAVNAGPERRGASYNIGTGVCTTIGELAALARQQLKIAEEPRFTMRARDWDVPERWFANPERARRELGWQAEVPLARGLELTAEWIRALPDRARYLASSKQPGADLARSAGDPAERYSVSAIVACYLDGQAIPIMHERLTAVFGALGIEYEIIFVNDCSPDDSEEVIRKISERDPHVIGISHSRNFGSQSAFRSGMEIASKNACVLLDGDLQDPPEVIPQLHERWREGYDVVYGRRVKREAPLFMQAAYKLFYRLFDRFSYLKIPHDAGDFSLMDRRVVHSLLQFPERDLFLRGLRAFVGFKQIGVDYVRPERMFGRSTNSLVKNVWWAKKGIFSFTYTPLNVLTAFGFIAVAVSMVLGLFQIATRLLYPELAPRGLTTVILLIMLFGSLNLLAVSVLGEYIAKIFEEVKRRPHFIRRSVIRRGEVRPAPDDPTASGGSPPGAGGAR
jgi:dolichol-phosphate mannosyltransferase